MPELQELTLDLCACARSAGADVVTEALLACPGVERAHVDAYVTWALAAFDPTRTSPDALVQDLAAAGFEVSVTRLFDSDSAAPPPDPTAPPQPCPPAAPEPTEEQPA